MTFQEARIAVAPFITAENAAKLYAETEKMLWIEDRIMDPAGIKSSICTDFGERICLYIEDALDAAADQEAEYCSQNDI